MMKEFSVQTKLDHLGKIMILCNASKEGHFSTKEDVLLR